MQKQNKRKKTWKLSSKLFYLNFETFCNPSITELQQEQTLKQTAIYLIPQFA